MSVSLTSHIAILLSEVGCKRDTQDNLTRVLEDAKHQSPKRDTVRDHGSYVITLLDSLAPR